MNKKTEPFVINQRLDFDVTNLVDASENFINGISIGKAKEIANEAKKDLVCFNLPDNNKKAFCKIIDYGKWKYEEQKKKKKNQKKQKQMVKEVRFSPLISDHDVEHKLRQVKDFLKHGDEVILSMQSKGAQRRHAEVGRQRMNEIVGMCEEYGEVENESMTGNQIIVRLRKATRKEG